MSTTKIVTLLKNDKGQNLLLGHQRDKRCLWQTNSNIHSTTLSVAATHRNELAFFVNAITEHSMDKQSLLYTAFHFSWEQESVFGS